MSDIRPFYGRGEAVQIREKSEVEQLRDEVARLRANLINCVARLAAYYGENYPAVREAKAALDGGKGVQGG